MFISSSRCSMRLYAGQNGEYVDVIRNVKVRISWYVDTYIKIQMAKIMISMEDPVVPLERNVYGHPPTELGCKRQYEKVLLKHDLGKVLNWEWLFVNRAKELFLSLYVNDMKMTDKTENMKSIWKILMKNVYLKDSLSFLDQIYVTYTQKECTLSSEITRKYRSQDFCYFKEKKIRKTDEEIISSWIYDIEGHTKKCVERYYEFTNKTTQLLYKVVIP